MLAPVAAEVKAEDEAIDTWLGVGDVAAPSAVGLSCVHEPVRGSVCACDVFAYVRSERVDLKLSER